MAQDWIQVGKTDREWLIIERADGTNRDMGYVDLQRFMPCYSLGEFGRNSDHDRRGLWSWLHRETGRKSSVTLVESDYEGGSMKHPIRVEFEDGAHELWHFGEHAYRRAHLVGLLVA